MRSAFLILLVAVLLAFSLGVEAGYYASRSVSLVQGMKRWVEEVKGNAQTAVNYAQNDDGAASP
jgi:hypothetical protein